MNKARFISLVAVAVVMIAVSIGVNQLRGYYDLAHPERLWLLLAIPILGFRHVFFDAHLYADYLFSSPAKSWHRLLPQLNRLWPHMLLLFGIGLLAIVAARPQSSSSYENLTREGINIILAMDVSGSMLSKDFEPNRLEASKVVAKQFIEARPNDRIGVVVYEAESITQVPLTSDHRVVKNTLSEIKTGLLEPGTAIGAGLATAINRMKEAEGKSNVIILMTDGMNNAGRIDPLDAAQLAELYGIRVYTIGVGTIGKAKSPVAIQNGQYIYDWVDVEIDEDLMHTIADMTGGKYFRATSKSKLENIYAEIDQLEKTRFNVLQYDRKKEEYFPFLLAAIVVFMTEFILRKTVFRTAL
jgi:Ca-activated chloride channel family protein